MVGRLISNSTSIQVPSGRGGQNPFAGGGGESWGNTGIAAVANTGGGGSGAGNGGIAANDFAGGGGGAGGYVDAWIANPSSTYSYAVGSGGSAGAAGTNGRAAGAGAAGIIIVEEYYQ